MVYSDRFTVEKHDSEGEFLGLAGRPKSAGEWPILFPNQLNSALEPGPATFQPAHLPGILGSRGSIRVVWMSDETKLQNGADGAKF